MAEVRSKVILYGPVWDGASQVSKHHLARHWASKGDRVLYVEAPFHLFSLASRPREVARLWRRFVGGPTEMEPNLWVQSYPALYPYRAGWPFTDFGPVHWLNQALVRGQLAGLCRRLGFHRPVILVGTATVLPLLEALDPSLVFYHCSDDYTRQPTFPSSYVRWERDLIDRSDMVICTAETLREAKADLHPNVHTVTNGVQIKHFARTQDPAVSLAPDLRGLRHPIVGYVGTVFGWLDQEMVARAAEARPDWSFVFVGPITTNVDRLRSLPNVHLLGPRPYAELPSYLKGFDVATVPFIFHDVTMRASPIKFYEYLASGVPVVATRLPNLEAFDYLAGLVSTPREFVAALDDAIDGETIAKREQRMAEARNHSWEARFSEIDMLVEEALKRKSREEGRSGNRI